MEVHRTNDCWKRWTKHRENERHSAWERYVNENPVATATLREQNIAQKRQQQRETSRTIATAWFHRKSSKITWKFHWKNDPRLAWELNVKKHVFGTVSLISKAKNDIKQIILEAQAHRSPARVFSDRKSNRIRDKRISPNATPADDPAQKQRYPEPDRIAVKNYQTRFQYD